MNIFLALLLVILGIIVLVLILGLFMRKTYFVQRDTIINAPVQKVFDYLRYLKNHDNFNVYIGKDPDMKSEFKGADGTVGFIYSWSGNSKAGEGEKEITAIEEGKSINTELRFVRPFKLTGYSNYQTESISENQTKVTASNSSKLKYPINIMIPMVEKNLPKDLDKTLSILKAILEKK